MEHHQDQKKASASTVSAAVTTRAYLSWMPFEILEEICKYLETLDGVHLSATNRHVQWAITHTLWKRDAQGRTEILHGNVSTGNLAGVKLAIEVYGASCRPQPQPPRPPRVCVGAHSSPRPRPRPLPPVPRRLESPLVGCIRGKYNMDVLRYLLLHGADPDSTRGTTLPVPSVLNWVLEQAVQVSSGANGRMWCPAAAVESLIQYGARLEIGHRYVGRNTLSGRLLYMSIMSKLETVDGGEDVAPTHLGLSCTEDLVRALVLGGANVNYHGMIASHETFGRSLFN